MHDMIAKQLFENDKAERTMPWVDASSEIYPGNARSACAGTPASCHASCCCCCLSAHVTMCSQQCLAMMRVGPKAHLRKPEASPGVRSWLSLLTAAS